MQPSSFISKEHLVNDVWTYYFTRPDGYDFLAGQYAEIIVPHEVADNRGSRRTFTFSSSPNEEELAITLKIPAACSSYKAALAKLNPGDTVQLSQPLGDLVLPLIESTPLIFIAGGLGIASFRSMLVHTTEAKEHRPIELHYALRDASERIFEAEIEESSAQASLYTSENKLSVYKLKELQNNNALFYISGSENFVMSIKNSLLAEGVSSTNIVFDYYDGYAEL